MTAPVRFDVQVKGPPNRTYSMPTAEQATFMAFAEADVFELEARAWRAMPYGSRAIATFRPAPKAKVNPNDGKGSE